MNQGDLQTFGPVVTKTMVLDTLERMLAAWAEEYIRLVERTMGVTVGQTVPPVHFPRRVDLRTLPGDQLPCWVIIGNGYAGPPVAGGDGIQRVPWDIQVVPLVSGGGGLVTDLDAELDVHLSAAGTLLSNQPIVAPNADDVTIDRVDILDRRDNAIPGIRQRNLMGGVLELAVHVDNVARYTAGPSAPPRSDPTPPYPAASTITHRVLTVQPIDEES